MRLWPAIRSRETLEAGIIMAVVHARTRSLSPNPKSYFAAAAAADGHTAPGRNAFSVLPMGDKATG